jgi:hypothetical protein
MVHPTYSVSEAPGECSGGVASMGLSVWLERERRVAGGECLNETVRLTLRFGRQQRPRYRGIRTPSRNESSQGERGPGRTEFDNFFFGNPVCGKEDEVDYGVET